MISYLANRSGSIYVWWDNYTMAMHCLWLMILV